MGEMTKKIGFEILSTREGQAFARMEIGKDPAIEDEKRAQLEKAIETPELLKGTELEDAYLGVLKRSKDFFIAKNFFNPRHYIWASMVFDNGFKPEPPKTEHPPVKSHDDGRVELSAKSWEFVKNLNSYARSAVGEEPIKRFLGYMDIERDLLILAPAEGRTHADIMRKAEEEGAPIGADPLPVLINYHASGDAYSVSPYHADDAGTHLTKERFDEGVDLVRRRFFPYTSDSSRAVWESHNPMINPFEFPFGHSTFVYIEENAYGTESQAYPSTLAWKIVKKGEGQGISPAPKSAVFSYKPESKLGIDTVFADGTDMPRRDERASDDDPPLKSSAEKRKGSSAVKTGKAAGLLKSGHVPSGSMSGVPLK